MIPPHFGNVDALLCRVIMPLTRPKRGMACDGRSGCLPLAGVGVCICPPEDDGLSAQLALSAACNGLV